MNVVLMVSNIHINPSSALIRLTWISVLELWFPWVQKRLVYFLKELWLMPIPQLSEAQGKRTLLFL